MKQTAIRPLPRRKSAFRRWVVRHSRLITYLGATIVILTYIVKEGFRESAKDEVERIEMAQRQFDVEDQISQLRETVETTQRGDNDFLFVVTPPSELSVDDLVEKEAGHRIRWAANRLTDLSNLETLAVTLPKGPEHERTIARFKKTVNQIQSEASQEWQDGIAKQAKTKSMRLKTELLATTRHSAVPVTQATVDTPLDIILTRFRQETKLIVLYTCDTLWERIKEEILSEANADRVKKEWWYEAFTQLSYFTYVVGWVLGLMGRVVGVSEEGARE